MSLRQHRHGRTGRQVKRRAGPDETGASILRVADRYKVDPQHIYAAWPAWMLNAAIEGLPQVAAHESMQLAEAVQVGNGNMKPGALRSTQQQWRREAKWALRERRRGTLPA